MIQLAAGNRLDNLLFDIERWWEDLKGNKGENSTHICIVSGVGVKNKTMKYEYMVWEKVDNHITCNQI